MDKVLFSELRTRIHIITSLVNKLFSDIDMLVIEINNEPDIIKKEEIKMRGYDLCDRLSNYKNDLEKLKGQLLQV